MECEEESRPSRECGGQSNGRGGLVGERTGRGAGTTGRAGLVGRYWPGATGRALLKGRC